MNKERLLALAALVEPIDEKNYDQAEYTFYCGTPACSLGHWAAAHPERWRFISMVQGGNFAPRLPVLTDPKDPGAKCEPAYAAMEEFDLTYEQAMNLFGGYGCDSAEDGASAAAYIRRFVEAGRCT